MCWGPAIVLHDVNQVVDFAIFAEHYLAVVALVLLAKKKEKIKKISEHSRELVALMQYTYITMYIYTHIYT